VPLELTNTLSRRKELFEPLDPAHVRMYVCGPTVYDTAHIGNARPVVVFDVLYRLLRSRYPKVTYVRNITDVDDRIIERSRTSGETIDALTNRTARVYQEDMAAINALPPDVEPRATLHIPHMIALIQRLIEKGHAYSAEGHVLFGVSSMPEYGRLSRRSPDELLAGARVEVAPYKRDPGDFVLWKPSPPDVPGWESPWGRGRPGWHIECSAMSETHLGETFDIHGGGLDLIFPHHENEIAQSSCAHDGAPPARYWVHNGFVIVEGEKMSKSLGNFFTVHDLLGEVPGEAIRLTLMATHYRQPLDFTRAALVRAKAALDRWYQALRGGPVPTDVPPPERLVAALEDDLNLPAAIAELHELAGAVNKAENPAERAVVRGSLLAGGRLIGLLEKDPEAWFRWAPKGAGELSDVEIDRLIEARRDARKCKDFAEADRVRRELADKGVVLEDGPKGTTWRRG